MSGTNLASARRSLRDVELRSPSTHRRMLPILAAFLLPLLASAASWAAPAATTTTLAVSSKVVNWRPITVMSATVKDTAPLSQGLVRFYDGKALLGSAQIVNTGTKYIKGMAYLSAELGPGSHSLKAVFAGTSSDATSASAVKQATVAGSFVSTVLSATGSAGNYTLTGQVMANSATAPTGTVSFVDQSSGGAVFGSANLGAGSAKRTFANSTGYPIYDTADYSMPQQVVAADFNGDGILDLAVLDYDTGLSIYSGNGDGTFRAAAPFCTTGTPPKPCGIGSEPTAIAVGDFNSDGIPDLVVASGSSVSVALGKGDGTFQPPANYDTASGGTEVRVADLDRDGTPDLVVSVDGGISVLLGNGDGTFQPHNETTLSDSSTYISIGDFNKDGIPDVVSVGWNGSAAMVLLGNGDGTFKAEKDTPIDINPAGCDVLAVDLKGTGYQSDLAFCGGSGVVEAAVGKGDGTFNTPQTLSVNGAVYEHVAGLTAADISGDGATDLILTWYSSDTDTGRVAVFTNKNDNSGTFNSTPASYFVGHQPVSVVAGDFNGDGALDLAVANENDGSMSVLLDNGGTMASAVLHGASVPGKGTQWVAAAYGGDSKYAADTSAPIALTGNGIAAPAITSISPTSVVIGSGAFTLTVNGTGFAAGAVVNWNGSARTTAFLSATKVTAAILAADVASAGAVAVTVTSGGVTSNSASFTITQSSGGGPTITSISPTSATAGGPAFTLTVNGTGFATGAVVKWNGNLRTTAFISATKVTAAITAADIASPGTATITVNTGGATTNSVNFTISAPAATPTLTAITPNYVTVGSPDLTLTLTGTGFVSGAAAAGSVVKWGTASLATTFVSATQLTAKIPAADLAAPGTTSVTVVNPGNLASAALPFTVAPATHAPLAYGFFNQNGTAGATSGNITCSWNTSEYLCVITGENFFYSKYVVNATVADTNKASIATVNSIGGQIIVKIYNLSGTAIQEPFYIAVFKP